MCPRSSLLMLIRLGPVSLLKLMIPLAGYIRSKTAHHCPVWHLCLFCLLCPDLTLPCPCDEFLMSWLWGKKNTLQWANTYKHIHINNAYASHTDSVSLSLSHTHKYTLIHVSWVMYGGATEPRKGLGRSSFLGKIVCCLCPVSITVSVSSWWIVGKVQKCIYVPGGTGAWE